jgi:hypothetical protein
VTGTVFWSPPNWWPAREQAESESIKICAQLAADLHTFGLPPAQNNNDQNTIIAALAVHQKTGKYGVAILNGAGEVLLKPDQYFDTPEEAFIHAKASRDKIQQISAQNGHNVKFLPIDKNDFIPPELTKLPEAPKPTKPPLLRPSHFDPTVN